MLEFRMLWAADITSTQIAAAGAGTVGLCPRTRSFSAMHLLMLKIRCVPPTILRDNRLWK